jgi:uncharacterized protein YggE
MEGKEKRLYFTILGLCLILSGLCGYFIASAASSPNSSSNMNTHTITVSGSGAASLRATIFTTYVGVETQANTTEDAMEQNAEKMNNVVSALRASGLTDDEMQTSQFSVSSVYDKPEWEGGIIIGFQVVNDLTIHSNKTDHVGKIIDAAVAAGANRVGDITFTLPGEKIQELKVEAMQKAAEDAKLRADTYATTLGTRIVGVISISEPTNYDCFDGGGRMCLSVDPSSETPILIGNASVSVTITVVFMIA